MKIAIVAPLVSAIREPQGGGSQAFVSDLARGLAGRGHDVHVYAATGSQIPGVTVIDTGVNPASLAATLYRAGDPAGRDPAAAAPAFASVYSAVRQARYDVIHNHAFDAPAISLAAGLNASVVHTLHLPPDPAIAAALRRAASSGEPPAVAGVSAFQASAWRGMTRVDAILPPYVPTQLIPWSAVAEDGALFAGAESREGSRRGDRYRPGGRNPDQPLRRRLRRGLCPGADRLSASRARRDGTSRGAPGVCVEGDGPGCGGYLPGTVG